MEHEVKPLIRNYVLIIVGAFVIAGITLFGILNNPGEVIKEDVLMGPIIATSRIVVPLFFAIGLIILFARLRKCKSCGKILFWRKNTQH